MKVLLRSTLAGATLFGFGMTLGCTGEPPLQKGDTEAKIAPVDNTKKKPQQGGPPVGSSAGMNVNPGASN